MAGLLIVLYHDAKRDTRMEEYMDNVWFTGRIASWLGWREGYEA